jgi:hypothetical protein
LQIVRDIPDPVSGDVEPLEQQFENFQCHMPGKQRLENQKQCLPELDIDLCFLFASWLQIITCARNPTETTDISKYLAVTLISKKFLSRYSDHGSCHTKYPIVLSKLLGLGHNS